MSSVLKNLSSGPLKSSMCLLFSVNLAFTYAMMLAPPREYIERALLPPLPTPSTRPGPLDTKGGGSQQQGDWMRRNVLRACLVLFTFGASFVGCCRR